MTADTAHDPLAAAFGIVDPDRYDPAEVTEFWRAAGEPRWFGQEPAFDALFRGRFLVHHFVAAARRLDHWEATAEGSLALLVLLDQFPRNAFRGTAHMYATDPLARRIADEAIAAGHDMKIEPALRLFFYLPFCHSESLEDQDRALALIGALATETSGEPGDDPLDHARGHHDIIRRFGRFPHRNPILGRETTTAEAAYLAAGGFAG